MAFTITINQREITVNADADTPLLWVIRDHVKLLGTKFGCGKGLCGACTVHLGKKAVRSCQIPIAAVKDQPVTTIEGLNTRSGQLLTSAWRELDVPQCGYCQPGQIMSACAFLENLKEPPTTEQIKTAMAGNLCRCGTYQRILQAIDSAAKELLRD